MPQDVREYFRKCSVRGEKQTAYTAAQLARGGVSDMDTLCALLGQEPEKLLSLRNIGPKGMEAIHKVCTCYQSERGDAL